MMAGFLLALLVDVVFDRAARTHRSFAEDVERHLDGRGSRPVPNAARVPGR
jgi:hypothetical protein